MNYEERAKTIALVAGRLYEQYHGTNVAETQRIESSVATAGKIVDRAIQYVADNPIDDKGLGHLSDT